MLPCRSDSRSRVAVSKLLKYGSSSGSVRFCVVGGNRPKTCGPGMVWAAEEGMTEYFGGDDGVPLAFVLDADFSFADEDGRTSHW